MTIKIVNNEVAVDTKYYWLQMSSCPKNVKVQLYTIGKIGTYGIYTGKEHWAIAWAPLPKVPKWLKPKP